MMITGGRLGGARLQRVACLGALSRPAAATRPRSGSKRQRRTCTHAQTDGGDRPGAAGGAGVETLLRPAMVPSSSAEANRPGYPLEWPGPVWGAAAAFAYSFYAIMVFNDAAFPELLRALIFGVFRSHDNIVAFSYVAIGIHVAYVLFVLGLSRRRGYDAKASAWWAVQSFVFGFLGVKLFLDRDQ